MARRQSSSEEEEEEGRRGPPALGLAGDWPWSEPCAFLRGRGGAWARARLRGNRNTGEEILVQKPVRSIRSSPVEVEEGLVDCLGGGRGRHSLPTHLERGGKGYVERAPLRAGRRLGRGPYV